MRIGMASYNKTYDLTYLEVEGHVFPIADVISKLFNRTPTEIIHFRNRPSAEASHIYSAHRFALVVRVKHPISNLKMRETADHILQTVFLKLRTVFFAIYNQRVHRN